MLKKKQFVEILNWLKKEEFKAELFEKALREYAGESDFTGFYKNTNDVLDWLVEVMEDNGEWIYWWLYDTECGKHNTQVTQGAEGTPEYREWNIKTPEDLYDFLYFDMMDHTDLNMKMCLTQQTEGVRFALKIIKDIMDLNEETANEGWHDRNALLDLISAKIVTEYRIQSGIFKDLYPLDDVQIISKLKGEE